MLLPIDQNDISFSCAHHRFPSTMNRNCGLDVRVAWDRCWYWAFVSILKYAGGTICNIKCCIFFKGVHRELAD